MTNVEKLIEIILYDLLRKDDKNIKKKNRIQTEFEKELNENCTRRLCFQYYTNTV